MTASKSNTLIVANECGGEFSSKKIVPKGLITRGLTTPSIIVKVTDAVDKILGRRLRNVVTTKESVG